MLRVLCENSACDSRFTTVSSSARKPNNGVSEFVGEPNFPWSRHNGRTPVR